jgi:hypothetical protein
MASSERHSLSRQGKKFLVYSVVFSLMSIGFWCFIYFKSRHNQNFAYYGTLDGIPLGLVLKIFKTQSVQESLSFTIVWAQVASLFFWNFIALIFSLRLKWIAIIAIILDVGPGALILTENSTSQNNSVHFQGEILQHEQAPPSAP